MSLLILKQCLQMPLTKFWIFLEPQAKSSGAFFTFNASAAQIWRLQGQAWSISASVVAKCASCPVNRASWVSPTPIAQPFYASTESSAASPPRSSFGRPAAMITPRVRPSLKTYWRSRTFLPSLWRATLARPCAYDLIIISIFIWMF